MMSLRNWLCLMVIYVLYLLLGGYSFNALENPSECDKKLSLRELQKELRNKIDELQGNLSVDAQDRLRYILEEIDANFLGNLLFSNDSTVYTNATDGGGDELCPKWNLYNSIFFAFTAVTTIGYGHLAPATDGGKLLCVFYSLLGVPINGILIGSLGNYFGSKLKNLTKNATRAKSEAVKILMLGIDVVIYMIPGVMVFVLAPAGVFTVIEEGWDYLDSFYFAFVTLTTIGFGDYVAGRDPVVLERLGDWKIVYEIGLIVWIILGMGYIFMIITVIADALRKPARKAAKRFRAAEKVMLSRIVQELLVMKSAKQSWCSSPRVSLPLVVCDDLLDGTDGVRKSQSLSHLQQPSLAAKEHYDNFGMLFDDIHISALRANEEGFDMSSDEDDDHQMIGDEEEGQEQQQHQDSSASSGDIDLDHDTITSLHQFMKTNKNQQLLVENNIPSAARRLNRSRQYSLNSEELNCEDGEVRWQPPNLHHRRAGSVQNTPASSSGSGGGRRFREFGGVRKRRISIASSPPRMTNNSAMNLAGAFIGLADQQVPTEAATLQDILRTTTLEEFLKAAEKVKREYLSSSSSDDADDSSDVIEEGFHERRHNPLLSSMLLHLRPQRSHDASEQQQQQSGNGNNADEKLSRSVSIASINAHLLTQLNRLFGGGSKTNKEEEGTAAAADTEYCGDDEDDVADEATARGGAEEV